MEFQEIKALHVFKRFFFHIKFLLLDSFFMNSTVDAVGMDLIRGAFDGLGIRAHVSSDNDGIISFSLHS